ncbi:helix-turn-helix domain-containing protein [Paraferrimonas sp. SM1919]|uniref:helix-turn-helix domain-containing protein n=1 Tax=Paraferrimonas sp. SM1919 TaxID=2662263 RepID=UPI0013D48B75|nr:helix-turn-helix domain-containing protein [Paraferrimonas sp. SM1919]
MKVGQRIKQLRQQQGLSQRQLAKSIELPNSTLSMIERDTVSPSISNLHKILMGLDTSLSSFFSQNIENSSPIIYKQSELPDIGAKGVSYLLVGANVENRKLTFMLENYPPQHGTGDEFITHPGDEAGLVLQGSIYIIQGQQSYQVKEGDCYYINAEIPHKFINKSNSECQIVSAISPANF